MIDWQWSYCDGNGIFTGRTHEGPKEWIAAFDGESAVDGIHDPLSKRYDFATGTVIDWQPPKPVGDEFTDHEWDDEIKRWLPVPTLAGLKRDAWEQVKRIREQRFDAVAASSAGVLYSITRDADNLARLIRTQDEKGAPPSQVEMWKAQDGVFHPLDRAGLALLAADMGDRGKAIFGHSWLIEALIGLAVDEKDLARIDLEYGWP